jgi:hypothetical protein
MLKITTLLTLLALFMLPLYGCDDRQPQATQPTPAPTSTQPILPVPSEKPTEASLPSNPALALLAEAQNAMSHLKTYHVSMTTEGDVATPAPTPSPDSDGAFLIPVALEGDVALPDKERVLANVGRASDFVSITIGGNRYIKQPAWDNFMERPLPAPKAGDPMSGPLIDIAMQGAFDTPSQIWTFTKSVTAFSVVGDETMDGVDTIHIRLLLDLGRTDDLVHKSMENTFNKIGAGLNDSTPVPTSTPGSLGQITRDLWIAKATKYIVRVRIEHDTSIKGALTFTYSHFDEPISPPILPPANATPIWPDGTPIPWQP